MPSVPGNRARRQLPGAAAAGVTVCNLSNAVGEENQRMSTRQHQCEEPRKWAGTLRSHLRDAVGGQGGEKQEKYETSTDRHQLALPAPSEGKQHHQQAVQRKQVSQHLKFTCSTWSLGDATATSSGQRVESTNCRLGSSVSAADASTTDATEAAPEKSVETNSTAPVETASTAEAPATPAAAPSAGDRRSAPPVAGAADRNEDLCPNRALQIVEQRREAVSKEANSVPEAGPREKAASCDDLCHVYAGAAQRAQEDEAMEGNHQQDDSPNTGELVLKEGTEALAGNSCRETSSSTSNTESSEHPAQNDGSKRTTLKPLQENFRRRESEATLDSQSTCSVQPKPSGADLQGKQDSLSAAGSDTTKRELVQGASTREGPPIHQQGSPAEGAPIFEESQNRWERRSREEGSTPVTSSGQHNAWQEQPIGKEALLRRKTDDEVCQPSVTYVTLQTVPQRTQRDQVMHQEHLRQGEQPLAPKQEEQQFVQEPKVLHRPLRVLPRSEQFSEGAQPPLSEEPQDEQQLRTRDAEELDKRLACTPGGAGRRQGDSHQTGGIEDIRFLLRLGGGETSLPRSVHVSNAFLKDSRRAQRFFCKLFGVDIGEVIGLVDEQGFVSPFDGEELFIRNGETYTLELAHTRKGEAAEHVSRSVPAVAFPLDAGPYNPQYPGERTVAVAPCKREALRAAGSVHTAGGQQGFATEWTPMKQSAVAVRNSESERCLGTSSARAARQVFASFVEQDFCKEEYSAADAEREVGQGGARDVRTGQPQSQALQKVVFGSSTHMRHLPLAEQQAWRQASQAPAATGSMRMRDAQRSNFVCLEGGVGADMRNIKDCTIWGETSGGTREDAEEVRASAGACRVVARNGIYTSSGRQPGGAAADIRGPLEQGIRNPLESLVHSGEEIRRGTIEPRGAPQHLHSQTGESLRFPQDTAEGSERAASLQRPRKGYESCEGADSLTGASQILPVGGPPGTADTQGMRTAKHHWRSLSHSGREEEGAFPGVPAEDFAATGQGSAKRSKLDEDGLSSTSQGQGGERQCPSSSLAFQSEPALLKKQPQARRASKLWISAPLLVWRRRRLRRTLPLHEPEDPEEVATRQLVAEQHVQAVLARVSQRRALRSHLQMEAEGVQGQQMSETDASRRIRKGTATSAAVAAPGTPQEGATKEGTLPRSMRRGSTPRGEPLLVDTLLWKKASTEKIYVHQTTSYAGATYTRKDTAISARDHGNASRGECISAFSGDHQLGQRQELKHQRHWRETQIPQRFDTSADLAAKEAADVSRGVKLGDCEEPKRIPDTVRDCPDPPRQYMLRPRLTSSSVKPGPLGKKVRPSVGDGSSLQRTQPQFSSGTGGEDPALNNLKFSSRPTSADDRRERAFLPSVYRRPNNMNSSGATAIQACEARSPMLEDVSEGRSRSGRTGSQRRTGRLEGQISEENRDLVGRNGTTSQNLSDTEGSEPFSTENSTEARGAGCDWKRKTFIAGRDGEQNVLQEVLDKRLFTASEIQRLLKLLETLKTSKQHEQQPQTLVERLRVLLPPETFNNLKLLLPSLLRTAERLTRINVKEDGKYIRNRDTRFHTSSTALQNDIVPPGGSDGDCENRDKEDV